MAEQKDPVQTTTHTEADIAAEKAAAEQKKAEAAAAKKAAKTAAPAPAPNMALVARDKDGNVDITKALEEIQTATGVIKLPPAEEQAEFFYMDPEMANRAKAAMPHLYKTPKAKGDK